MPQQRTYIDPETGQPIKEEPAPLIQRTQAPTQQEQMQEYIDEKTGEVVNPAMKAMAEVQKPVNYAERTGLGKEATDAMAQGSYLGTGLNFVRDMMGSIVTPFTAATAGFGLGESVAAKAGYPIASKLMQYAGRTASLGMTAEGVKRFPDEPIAGGLEALAGVTGMRIGAGNRVKFMEKMGPAQGKPVLRPIQPGIDREVLNEARDIIRKYEGNLNKVVGKPAEDILKYAQAIEPGFQPKPQTPEAFILKGGHPEHVNQLEKQGFIAGERVAADSPDIYMYKPIDRPDVELPQLDLANARKPTVAQELLNTPRNAMTGVDLSAPLRQGFNLIHRPEFRKNLIPMLEQMKSEQGFQEVQNAIKQHPNFQQGQIMGPGGKLVTMRSFADRAGLKLSDLNDITGQEEARMGQWIESVPGIGKLYRGSNRAYVGFLNKLRADTFNSMIADLEKAGIPVKSDMPRAKMIAEFINDATGKGSLGTGWLEEHAAALNNAFFSPRLMASRVRMYNRYLNPWSYANAPPELRKEALKSLMGMTAASGTFLTMMGMAGAEVGTDPDSADFGKAKVGNVRFDPWAGYQQYAVLAHRLMTNETTSPGGKTTRLGEGFGSKSRKDVAEAFLANKSSPVWKFAYDWMNQTDYRPFNVPAESLRLVVPMMVQDIYDIAQEDPSLLPISIPASALGMGVQVYGSGN